MNNKFRKFFPIFAYQKDFIYLDSAATSLKPNIVIQAINDYYQKYSINSHSGSSNPLFNEVQKTIQQTRQIIARQINAKSEEIIFLPSTTYSLNILTLSLKNYLEKGEKIALTHLEHSSNCYPWQSIAQEKEAQIDFLPLNKNFTIDFNELENYIDRKTKIVSFSHMSNSLGVINPVKEITKKIKKINPNCLVIIDACQRGGKRIGPNDKIENDFPLAKKFEVGTLPLAQIFGLQKSFEFLNGFGIREISNYEKELKDYAITELAKLKKIIIYNQNLETVDLVLFNLSGYHPHDVADYLGKNNICVRAVLEIEGIESAKKCLRSLQNGTITAFGGKFRGASYDKNAERIIKQAQNSLKEAIKKHNEGESINIQETAIVPPSYYNWWISRNIFSEEKKENAENQPQTLIVDLNISQYRLTMLQK
ncbi:10714_t:CDS:2 [Funneliformis geosporum]|uniref:10714_t:CDS:1 n=1 Tax=Funneliformis geosporum TaxID=1117311 RepID=A0A9W4WTH7_9GLOM|nr:10714_t:CDS:2 [Funneliformis geosporum]